jgi:hypothetical protein
MLLGADAAVRAFDHQVHLVVPVAGPQVVHGHVDDLT